MRDRESDSAVKKTKPSVSKSKKSGWLAQNSNQGWEALNGYMKSAIHRSSQRGGSANTHRSSLIKFLRNLCLRRLGYRLEGDINVAKPDGWFSNLVRDHIEMGKQEKRSNRQQQTPHEQQEMLTQPTGEDDTEPDWDGEGAEAEQGVVNYVLEDIISTA